MTIETVPLGDGFGVEIRGVDLATPMDDDTFVQVRQAFEAHGVALFRDQALDPAAHVAFAGRFGELWPMSAERFPLPDHPEVAVLSNIVVDGKPLGLQLNIGVEWHADGSANRRPGRVTSLYAVETLERGGDTLYADAASAWEAMPGDLKARAQEAQAVYNYAQFQEKIVRGSGEAYRKPLAPEAYQDIVRPLVRIHPGTGRAAPIFSIEEVIRLEGLSPCESRALLEELLDFVTQDRFVYRHVWKPGDLVLHDNRSTLHSATDYVYKAERRLMHRVISLEADDQPIAAEAAA